MENKEQLKPGIYRDKNLIVLPSGTKVYFKTEDELTYGDFIAIKEESLKSIRGRINPNNNDIDLTFDLSTADNLFSYVRILIKKIEKPDGSVIQGNADVILNAIRNLSYKDGVFFEEKVRAIISEIENVNFRREKK